MDLSEPANTKPTDIASASIPDTLATLHVNPDTGLTQAEVDADEIGLWLRVGSSGAALEGTVLCWVAMK